MRPRELLGRRSYIGVVAVRFLGGKDLAEEALFVAFRGSSQKTYVMDKPLHCLVALADRGARCRDPSSRGQC